MWDYADEDGERAIYMPLAAELRRQQEIFAELAGQGEQHVGVASAGQER